MTGIRRTGLALVLISLLVGLVWLSIVQRSSDRVAATGLLQAAQQEKNTLLAGIAEGQILHILIETYQKNRLPGPAALDGAWGYPDRTQGEIWLSADENGNISTYVTATRDLEGILLQRSLKTDGRRESTDIATGRIMSFDTGRNTHIASWINGMWDHPQQLREKGWTLKGQRQLNGRQSIVHEMSFTIPADENQEERNMVREIEFAETTPLIWRSTLWKINGQGERTLAEENKVLDIQLLPANHEVTLPE